MFKFDASLGLAADLGAASYSLAPLLQSPQSGLLCLALPQCAPQALKCSPRKSIDILYLEPSTRPVDFPPVVEIPASYPNHLLLLVIF
jgi:hypothetical protein